MSAARKAKAPVIGPTEAFKVNPQTSKVLRNIMNSTLDTSKAKEGASSKPAPALSDADKKQLHTLALEGSWEVASLTTRLAQTLRKADAEDEIDFDRHLAMRGAIARIAQLNSMLIDVLGEMVKTQAGLREARAMVYGIMDFESENGC